jgi:hypothetical protein
MPDRNDATGLGARAENELAAELAQLVLEDVAPEELAVFDETAQEYFEDPKRVLTPRRRDEPVGFGIELALVTPYVIAAVMPAVQFLASTVAETVREESKPVVADLVRRLFRRVRGKESDVPAEPAPNLTPDQVRRVRDLVYERASALGLGQDQARLISDSTAGALLVPR